MGRIAGPIAIALLVAALPVSPAAAGDIRTDGAFVSTATSGEPLEVSSTERVSRLNADMVDGVHGSDLARSLGNVLTVAESGGDFGTIQEAMDSIYPSRSNPYFVFVGPGSYSAASIKDYVHLQGAGERLTEIRAPSSAVSTLDLGAGSSISDMTLSHDLGAAEPVALLIEGEFGVTVRRVTLRTSGATTANVPLKIVDSRAITLEDISVSVREASSEIQPARIRGVLIDDSRVELRELDVDVWSLSSRCHGVRIEGESDVEMDGGDIYVHNDGDDVGVVFGVFADGSQVGGSPDVIMEEFSITAGGGADNRGVQITDSTFEIRRSEISVGSSGKQARGVRVTSDELIKIVTLRDSKVLLYSQGGVERALELFDRSADGSGYGSLDVWDSEIYADDSTAHKPDGAGFMRLIRSHLKGGPVVGTVTCRLLTYENWGQSEFSTVYESSCPR